MEFNPEILKIVRALALTENGGKIPDQAKAGQSGELKSIFQFTPGTWKMYSKEVLGHEAPMTNENESAVTYGKVAKWIQDGFKPDEIASIWNSGKPDSYLQDHKGTNKFGVKYDTPGYVKKFNEHLSSSGEAKTQPLIQGNFAVSQPIQSQTPPQAQTQSQTQSPSQPNTLPNLMQKNMKQVRQI